uniref:Sushi domain-containing protein n=2 Tax=Macrostomum lignano TaxID=282301 RepID=A0A1I8H6W9_9PLAT
STVCPQLSFDPTKEIFQLVSNNGSSVQTLTNSSFSNYQLGDSVLMQCVSGYVDSRTMKPPVSPISIVCQSSPPVPVWSNSSLTCILHACLAISASDSSLNVSLVAAGMDPANQQSYGATVSVRCSAYGHILPGNPYEADTATLRCNYTGWDLTYSIDSAGRTSQTFPVIAAVPGAAAPSFGACIRELRFSLSLSHLRW